jgi:hypothetical protein
VIDFIWLELPSQYIAMTRNNLSIILISLARSSVHSILWSCYVMIGFVMTTNLSQLKIAQLQSKNTLALGPSINDVGNFSGFLTPPPPCGQFFITIHWQFGPMFDPSPYQTKCNFKFANRVKIIALKNKFLLDYYSPTVRHGKILVYNFWVL